MIIMGLKMLQRDTNLCNCGNPADNKPKVHIIDTHRTEYVRHDHRMDGEHVVV